MNLLPHLSDTIKGLLLLLAGFILLFDTLGIAPQILHTIVLFGSIGMIVYGIYLANLHMRLYKLLTKKDKPDEPEQ